MPNLVTINFYEMYEKNKYLKVSKVQLFYKKKLLCCDERFAN